LRGALSSFICDIFSARTSEKAIPRECAFLIIRCLEHIMKLARFAQLAFTALAVVVCVRASPLYVGQFNSVGEYDSLTGAAINANFITGLGSPHGLALSGNTLFVANYYANTVGEYNATTGAAINANFITGLGFPHGLALSDNTLFVSYGGSIVGKYNATTGAAINPYFIAGLGYPMNILVSGNTLFVFNDLTGTIGAYNAITGATINASFTTVPGGGGFALSGNTFFVSSLGHGVIGEYNATTGAAINANFITGLTVPDQLALSGNTLFVPNYFANTVGEYNATTGAAIDPNFISGLNGPVVIIAPSVPEPSTWSLIALGGVALLGFILRRKKPHHVGINVGAATARIARGVLQNG
jgi:hypothetical protein